MAIGDTPTLLSLDRYAEIIGLNPAHFNNAQNQNVMPVTAACSHVFYQEDWQAGDRVSRNQLAREIANAEKEIAEFIGFWPAPVWIEDEVRRYTRPHRPDWIGGTMRDVRGYRKGIKTRWGKLIEPGRRVAVHYTSPDTVIGDLAYIDADGDGYIETARVRLLGILDLFDLCDIKVYFSDWGAAPQQEIRPWRYALVNHATGDLDLMYWAWQFILPGTIAALPTIDTPTPVDFTDTPNLVTEVEVYQVYNDPTSQSAEFYWEPDVDLGVVLICPACQGDGCEVCSLTYQAGCCHVADVEGGILVPTPGTYDAADARWEYTEPTVNRDPDVVKMWYYAGDRSQRSLATLPVDRSGQTRYQHNACDELSTFWAETIAWIATARLRRTLCGCNNVKELVNELQTPVDRIPQAGDSFTVTEEDLQNPFGTKIGEVRAWRRLARIARRKVESGVLP